MSALVSIDKLTVQFRGDRGWVSAVDDVSFDIGEGECVGVVGELGSGKSVTALSMLRLHPRGAARFPSGSIVYGGLDLLRAPERDLRAVRGRDIAMVFQDPMSSLNPVLTHPRPDLRTASPASGTVAGCSAPQSNRVA